MLPRGKLGWSFWLAAALLALPLLYVASFGPACWICDRYELPSRVVANVYRPLIRVTLEGPAPVRAFLRSYAHWYAPPLLFPVIVTGNEPSKEELTAIHEFMVHGIIEKLHAL